MGSKSGGCNSSTRDDKINVNNNVKKLDNWRQYFRKSNCDIFDIIEHAIMVAALDCPKEYRVRKARIAELLFSCKQTRCPHLHHDVNDGVVMIKSCFVDDHGVGSKGSKVNSTSRDDDDDDDDDDDEDDVDIDGGGGGGGSSGGDDEVNVDVGGEMELIDDGMGVGPSSNISYGDVEALTDLIEQEKELIVEVLRIKDVLYNSQDESNSVVLESLRRLQLMHLSINILKETEIGKAVNHIKKHSSQEIRHLARSLIAEWKIVVDEWMLATQKLAEGGTPDSINLSTVEEEEEGLPEPPMDEGVFFTTQTMDFNQFFDGMDDDGNPRNSGEFNKNRGSTRKPSSVKPDAPKRREELPKEVTPTSKDNRLQHMKSRHPVPKPSQPSNMPSGTARPLKPNGDVKVSQDSKFQPKPEIPFVQRRPMPQTEKPRSSNEDSVQEKLEATKRRLQERYQQAENAKRQRTIQVMEIRDLPKQGLVNKNPNAKFGNHNRHWAYGRK